MVLFFRWVWAFEEEHHVQDPVNESDKLVEKKKMLNLFSVAF